MDIACLIPVLGRHEGIRAVSDSLKRVTPEVHPYFICSKSRPKDISECIKTGGNVLIAGWEPEKADFARKINLGYRETVEEWLFQAATDVEFTFGWLEALERCVEHSGASVIGTYDGGNPLVMRGGHSTHSLVRRSYVEDPGASFDGPGIVFSEAYDHQSVDVELIQVAKHHGAWAFCREAEVLHHHPFWKGTRSRSRLRNFGDLDETYRKGLEHGQADARLYALRYRSWLKARR